MAKTRLAVITCPDDVRLQNAADELAADLPVWTVDYQGNHEVVPLPNGRKVLALFGDEPAVTELHTQSAKGDFTTSETEDFDENEELPWGVAWYCWAYLKGLEAGRQEIIDLGLLGRIFAK